MKRSQVNAIIKEALDFAGQMNFKLPPFAYWKWEDYLRKGKEEEYREFFDNMLGWDVTDFGHGNFEKCGLLMLCIRNGNFFKKEYAKKICGKDARSAGRAGHAVSSPLLQNGRYHQPRRRKPDRKIV